jgi:hypothetical protein
MDRATVFPAAQSLSLPPWQFSRPIWVFLAIMSWEATDGDYSSYVAIQTQLMSLISNMNCALDISSLGLLDL